MAKDESGNPGRGIQYPFKEPAPGDYHASWEANRLEPWKEVVRKLIRYHAADETATLGQISTEFIPSFDYGEGCRYSLFEQAIAYITWMRETWDAARGQS